MQTPKSKMPKSERDRIVIAAIKRAINAMALLQGTKVTTGRKSGFIDVERELYILFEALRVMGLDFGLPAFREPGPTEKGTGKGSHTGRPGTC